MTVITITTATEVTRNPSPTPMYQTVMSALIVMLMNLSVGEHGWTTPSAPRIAGLDYSCLGVPVAVRGLAEEVDDVRTVDRVRVTDDRAGPVLGPDVGEDPVEITMDPMHQVVDCGYATAGHDQAGLDRVHVRQDPREIVVRSREGSGDSVPARAYRPD